VTDEKDCGNAEGVGVGHFVFDGKFLSSGEHQVDCANEVGSGGSRWEGDFLKQNRYSTLWSLVELNGESEVRIGSARVGSEVNRESEDLESIDEQKTVQVSCDWGTEICLENGIGCLSGEVLTIDEGNWNSGWCWLSLANEGG